MIGFASLRETGNHYYLNLILKSPKSQKSVCDMRFELWIWFVELRYDILISRKAKGPVETNGQISAPGSGCPSALPRRSFMLYRLKDSSRVPRSAGHPENRLVPFVWKCIQASKVIQGHGKHWKPEIFGENPVSGRRKCRENPLSESDDPMENSKTLEKIPEMTSSRARYPVSSPSRGIHRKSPGCIILDGGRNLQVEAWKIQTVATKWGPQDSVQLVYNYNN